MLWYKGWLETRAPLVIVLGCYVALFAFVAAHPPKFDGMPTASQAVAVLRSLGMTEFVATLAILLGGAGVRTPKSPLRPGKGLYGSTQYTLSLPVTRLRLLAVRAGMGWLEMATATALVCWGWLMTSGPVRNAVAPLDMVKYAAALIVCGTGVYAAGVVLYAFTNARFGAWAGLMILVQVLEHYRVPVSVDFWAVSQGSRAVAYAMPWTAMLVSAVAGAVLFAGAVKIIRAREF